MNLDIELTLESNSFNLKWNFEFISSQVIIWKKSLLINRNLQLLEFLIFFSLFLFFVNL